MAVLQIEKLNAQYILHCSPNSKKVLPDLSLNEAFVSFDIIGLFIGPVQPQWGPVVQKVLQKLL